MLDRALTRQGESVHPGDPVLIHTGWTRWFLNADADLRREVRHARCAVSRATGQWDCLTVVKPLNLTGGVGSPANATALQ